LQKIDAQTNTVNYAYDPVTGRLLTRSWARMIGGNNVMVTNSYDGYGDLMEQDYNDGTASVYYNNYNRSAQPREMVDASGTSELTYDDASRLVSSYYANGLLAGITVSNHFNPYFGRDSVAVLSSGTAMLEDDYGYDSYGRLRSVRNGNCVASYGYAPNSGLLASTTFKNGASTVLTTTRTWDYGTRLHTIANLVNGAPVTSHSYDYDALNRRTAAQLEDGSTWQYGYDDRDELTTASRIWAPWLYDTPVAGQQFTYAYDNIGNRLTAASGGDTNGLNLWTNYYTANSLNQYSGIVTPGYQSIIGVALPTNSVTVNGGAADRKAEYFHREIAVANGSGPVWQNVTNISGTFTNRGGLLVPANSQSLVYGADGNLTADGIWTYQWDGENRLVSMEMNPSVSGLASSNCFRLDFMYDYMGRRVQKIVSVWNVATNNFVPATTNLFVYDGWNLLAVVNSQLSVLQSFLWGNDLSGTSTNAGGVGGLLLASISGTNTFPAYDGNGNITALINATDKTLAARYEYNPYGKLLRETGWLARQNPFCFSSKYYDRESGCMYYGFRYFNPGWCKSVSVICLSFHRLGPP
jgi:YD repeat-containing protein